jgi:translocation and assembly module TamB
VEASGQVQVQPGQGLSYDLRLSARQAALLHTRLIEAVVDGDFRLAGDLDSGSLAGAMTVDPARVRLPEQTPPEIVDLEVVRVGESTVNSGPGKEAPPYALELDVGISIPARFFVLGRGLDAEFAGRLNVSGMAAAPDITGSMNVVRGSYEFLDRRLDLEQGSLNFTGQGAIPFLDVTAVSRGSEVDAKVRLTGPADDFSLELTSDPPLPDNEIMARLLFGRRVADLNPVQALQLANALATLAGGRGGGGVLAEARRSLGLDQLVISGGEAGSAPAVGVGKYVRENVYLEVERDFTTGGEEVRVEVDLSPRTGVSGSASQYSGSEVGVHWKMNY